MSWNNKVIWSEGLFLRPQHFQQNDRYLESYVEGRCRNVRSHNWGIRELELDAAHLALGKITITRCIGILPDGTPINIPENDSPPDSIDIGSDVKEKIIYLALPNSRVEGIQTDVEENSESTARFTPQIYNVRDNIAGNNEKVSIEIGKLRLRLVVENAAIGQFSYIGIARVTEIQSDKKIILDENYIPPCLDCSATPNLSGYIKEIVGLLHQRGDALAGRVSDSGRGGSAEIADFMLLQSVNRYEPLISHLANTQYFHPESLYQLAISMAGEFSTFTSTSRRPVEFSRYNHDDLAASFAPVISELRKTLSAVLEQTAVPMKLDAHKYGIHVATIADRNLLGNANFVLAANAAIPTKDIAARFPSQVKAGPAEMISELVNLQLPGIAIRQMAVAPRQIPYHSGFSYFELDRNSDLWNRMSNSGGFAFHIGGEFPGLELEFWAIKE